MPPSTAATAAGARARRARYAGRGLGLGAGRPWASRRRRRRRRRLRAGRHAPPAGAHSLAALGAPSPSRCPLKPVLNELGEAAGIAFQPAIRCLLSLPRPLPPRSPVFNELGEVVGIAFQSYAGSDAENIGYVIPTPGGWGGGAGAPAQERPRASPAARAGLPAAAFPAAASAPPCPGPQACSPRSLPRPAVISHFLDDYQRNGTFTGFPALGVMWQRMESATLRCAAVAARRAGRRCGLHAGLLGRLLRAGPRCCTRGCAAPRRGCLRRRARLRRTAGATLKRLPQQQVPAPSPPASGACHPTEPCPALLHPCTPTPLAASTSTLTDAPLMPRSSTHAMLGPNSDPPTPLPVPHLSHPRNARSKHFKMGEDQKGVLVRAVQPTSFAKGVLQPGDVLVAFDGVEVACGERWSWLDGGEGSAGGVGRRAGGSDRVSSGLRPRPPDPGPRRPAAPPMHPHPRPHPPHPQTAPCPSCRASASPSAT